MTKGPPRRLMAPEEVWFTLDVAHPMNLLPSTRATGDGLVRSGGQDRLHTILVKPGVYRGPIQVSRQFAGTRERPTVIQSEVKWKAVIIGAEYHVISNANTRPN